MCGYGFLETLQERYDASEKRTDGTPKILIAPSWQEDNILDSCIDNLLDALLGKGYNVVVRPHPEYKKDIPIDLMQSLKDTAVMIKAIYRLNLTFPAANQFIILI